MVAGPRAPPLPARTAPLAALSYEAAPRGLPVRTLPALLGLFGLPLLAGLLVLFEHFFRVLLAHSGSSFRQLLPVVLPNAVAVALLPLLPGFLASGGHAFDKSV